MIATYAKTRPNSCLRDGACLRYWILIPLLVFVLWFVVLDRANTGFGYVLAYAEHGGISIEDTIAFDHQGQEGIDLNVDVQGDEPLVQDQEHEQDQDQEQQPQEQGGGEVWHEQEQEYQEATEFHDHQEQFGEEEQQQDGEVEQHQQEEEYHADEENPWKYRPFPQEHIETPSRVPEIGDLDKPPTTYEYSSDEEQRRREEEEEERQRQEQQEQQQQQYVEEEDACIDRYCIAERLDIVPCTDFELDIIGKLFQFCLPCLGGSDDDRFSSSSKTGSFGSAESKNRKKRKKLSRKEAEEALLRRKRETGRLDVVIENIRNLLEFGGDESEGENLYVDDQGRIIDVPAFKPLAPAKSGSAPSDQQNGSAAEHMPPLSHEGDAGNPADSSSNITPKQQDAVAPAVNSSLVAENGWRPFCSYRGRTDDTRVIRQVPVIADLQDGAPPPSVLAAMDYVYDPQGSGPAGPLSSRMLDRLDRGGYRSIAKVYPNASDDKPMDYWDYDRMAILWSNPKYYQVIRKLGKGKYSDVFEVFDTVHQRKAVVKILKPVKKKKIKREILILQQLRGGPNIVELYDVCQDYKTKIPALVFEYVDNHDYRTLFPKLTANDIQYYIFQVLKALEFAHSKGIFHRDIKPQNVMIDHEKRDLRVVDWGLGEFYHARKEYNVRVASRYFKGPELLVGIHDYDYSLDIWSLGCMFAGMLFQKEPFFAGADNDDQLVKITDALGAESLANYLQKYGIVLDDELQERVSTQPRLSWKEFINAFNKHLVDSNALDLLDKMLVMDHEDRITAKEAMRHPYFGALRAELGDEFR
eukprot:CAMPEP_0184691496 /NCGR_PEP_ID=MMETSP0313-20130426/337_1 /TAXON_ID=2792 /ORGANISM="Porphyridium aerugineum, Strain SAG 1380-2" /LENGTH=808 /DNA_ID=CAMNT_0027149229 /DNA_START=220 /DNA_END=2646 /DNA_ORIENTATION=+